MSTTAVKPIVYKSLLICDEPKCSNYVAFTSKTRVVARKHAKKQGWKVVNKQDICGDHD